MAGRVADIFDELNEDLRAERVARHGDALRAARRRACWRSCWAASAAGRAGSGGRRARRRPPPSPTWTRCAPRTRCRPAPGPARLAAADAFAKVAATAPAGYRTLARLREAGLRWDAGDTDAASRCGTASARTPTPTRCCATWPACSGRSTRWTRRPGGDRRAHPQAGGAGNVWRPLAREVDAAACAPAERQGGGAAAAPGPAGRPAGHRRPAHPRGEMLVLLGGNPERARMSRPPSRRLLLRAASLAPLAALPGCTFFDDLLESEQAAAARQARGGHGQHARHAGGPDRPPDGRAAAAGAERELGPGGRQPGARGRQRPARGSAPVLAPLDRRGRRLPAEDHGHPGHLRRPGVHHGLRWRRERVRRGQRLEALDHRDAAQARPQHQRRRRAGRGRWRRLRHHGAGRGAGAGRRPAARSAGGSPWRRRPARRRRWWTAGCSCPPSTSGWSRCRPPTASSSGATRRPPPPPSCWGSRRPP